MRRLTIAKLLGGLGIVAAVAGCYVRAATPVNNGYAPGAAQASPMVGTPAPNQVSSMPPEALYEQMTPSPGERFVWIDGFWHWNGAEWVWAGGRWEQEQVGYVYVQPFYNYDGGAYVYTPGYWSRPDHVPTGYTLRDRRDGRPRLYQPPSRPIVGAGPGTYRPVYRPIYSTPAPAPHYYTAPRRR